MVEFTNEAIWTWAFLCGTFFFFQITNSAFTCYVYTQIGSISTARGILPDRGTSPCPLHRQADSQPLHHQGSPRAPFFLAPNSIPLTLRMSFGCCLGSGESWLSPVPGLDTLWGSRLAPLLSSCSREEDPDDVPHGHITSLVRRAHPGSGGGGGGS